MTVRGLSTFVKATPTISKTIDIVEEIKNEKSKTGKSPIIILNLSCLIGRAISIAPFVVESICGGRGQMFLKRVEIFLKKLKDAGAELVFVSDSEINHNPNEKKWIEKHERRDGISNKIYYMVSGGASPMNIVEKIPHLHINVNYYGLIRKAVENYGTFNISTEATRDAWIGRYALEKKAFAVMADKSDMMIFEGVERIWKDVEVEAFEEFGSVKAFEMNSLQLRETLGLKAGDEMALWATLVGNDYLGSDITGRFLSQNRFQAVATYIKNLRGRDLEGMIPSVALYVSRAIRQSHRQNYITEQIQASMRYYRMEREEKPEVEDKLSKYLSYSILEDKAIWLTLPMDDKGNRNAVSVSKTAMEVVKRLCGVVLKYVEDDQLTRKVMINLTGKKLEKVLVKPTFPDFFVPGAGELIKGQAKDEYLFEKRVQILNFIFARNWTAEYLTKQEPSSVSFILALDVLGEMIEKRERELVWTCFQDGLEHRIPDDLEVPRTLKRRALGIVFALLNLQVLLVTVLSNIGVPQYAEMQPFDAVYFHKMYDEAL